MRINYINADKKLELTIGFVLDNTGDAMVGEYIEVSMYDRSQVVGPTKPIFSLVGTVSDDRFLAVNTPKSTTGGLSTSGDSFWVFSSLIDVFGKIGINGVLQDGEYLRYSRHDNVIHIHRGGNDFAKLYPDGEMVLGVEDSATTELKSSEPTRESLDRTINDLKVRLIGLFPDEDDGVIRNLTRRVRLASEVLSDSSASVSLTLLEKSLKSISDQIARHEPVE
mgnify:CR=1 FL=1